MCNNFEKKVMTIQGKGILPYHTLSIKNLHLVSKLVNYDVWMLQESCLVLQHIKSLGLEEKMVVTNYGTCSRKGFFIALTIRAVNFTVVFCPGTITNFVYRADWTAVYSNTPV